MLLYLLCEYTAIYLFCDLLTSLMSLIVNFVKILACVLCLVSDMFKFDIRFINLTS